MPSPLSCARWSAFTLPPPSPHGSDLSAQSQPARARGASADRGASGDHGRGARRDHGGWDQARLAVPQLSRVRLCPARARTLRSRAPLRPPRPRGPNAGEEDRVEPASQFGELAPGRGQSPRYRLMRGVSSVPVGGCRPVVAEPEPVGRRQSGDRAGASSEASAIETRGLLRLRRCRLEPGAATRSAAPPRSQLQAKQQPASGARRGRFSSIPVVCVVAIRSLAFVEEQPASLNAARAG